MEEAVSASPPFSACLGWRQQQRQVARLKLGRVVAAVAIALALAVVYPSRRAGGTVVVVRAFETAASLGRPVLCPYTTNFGSRKASAELPVKNKTKSGKAEDMRQLKEDLERMDDKRASEDGELALYELPPESTERGPASVEWLQSHLLRIRYYGYHKEQMNAATDAILNACRQIPSVIVKGPAMLPTQKKMFTLLRSPHIDKKSREQLFFVSHRRIIDIYPISNALNSTNASVSSFAEVELPQGVNADVFFLHTRKVRSRAAIEAEYPFHWVSKYATYNADFPLRVRLIAKLLSPKHDKDRLFDWPDTQAELLKFKSNVLLKMLNMTEVHYQQRVELARQGKVMIDRHKFVDM